MTREPNDTNIKKAATKSNKNGKQEKNVVDKKEKNNETIEKSLSFLDIVISNICI